MAFSCVMNEEKIYSFHFSPEQWIKLKCEYKQHVFRMPCCGAKALLKTSALGTQFFAHKTKSESCPSPALETREHLFAKYLISRTLFEMGWQVETEKKGITPQGKAWIADIYAEKGRAKMAVEVQWSPQSYEETTLRQQIYKDAGIRCVWLLRDIKDGHNNALTGDYRFRTKDIPVFTLVKTIDGAMRVHNIYQVNEKGIHLAEKFQPVSLELTTFIRHLFNGRFSFIPRNNDPNQYMSVQLINDTCWRCRRSIVIVGQVYYHQNLYGGLIKRWPSRTIRGISLKDVDFINQYFQPAFHFAKLSKRYSKTEKTDYMANSCPHCNAIMGKFFEENMYDDPSTIETPICTIACSTMQTDTQMAVGQWILDSTLPATPDTNRINYFKDENPSETPLDYLEEGYEHEHTVGVKLTTISKQAEVKSLLAHLFGGR